MAKVGRNIVTTGLSGKVGDLIVFRVLNGKTYVSQAPTASNQPLTDAQTQVRKRFQRAVLYAKSANANADSKAAYAAAGDGKGLSAYNVAVADFMHAPQIEEIDVSAYTGKAGETIRVLAVDDFEVADVTVTIENADGTQVESGKATLDSNGLYWTYTSTAANDQIEGDKITITVSDLPGNETIEQKDI